MRITFIIPFTARSGGIVVIGEHARRLAEAGHDVRVYYPLLPYGDMLGKPGATRALHLLQTARLLLGNLKRRATAIAWHGSRMPVTPVPLVSDAFVRDADAVVASAWPTAYDVAALGPRKGRKYYFVQGYETWTPRADRAEASYRLPLAIFTIAPWLTALMRERFGREPAAEIPNGVDTAFFRPPAWKDWARPSVLMMYHSLPLKGCAEGLAVLARVKRAHPDAEIVLFGMEPPPACHEWASFFLDPGPEALVRLYGEAAVFLSPSRGEGWGLTILEAMACQCAVVATESGCVPVIREEGNLLACAPEDAEAMFCHVDRLLRDPETRRSVALAGHATALRRDWRASSRLLEAALLAGARGDAPER